MGFQRHNKTQNGQVYKRCDMLSLWPKWVVLNNVIEIFVRGTYYMTATLMLLIGKWQQQIKRDRNSVKEGRSMFEKKLREEAEERRQKRKERVSRRRSLPTQGSDFVCNLCDRDCHSRIGLYSHSRKCTVVPEASSDLTVLDVPLSTHSYPYCRITFTSQYGLYSHLRTHHLHSVDWELQRRV